MQFIIQRRLADCGFSSNGTSLSAAQLRAALVEGSNAVYSSGKGGGEGLSPHQGPEER